MASGSERDLVAAARQRDAAAFEALLRPLIEPGYRLAYSMLQRREEAEDAVQEAALNAWRGVHRLSEGTESLRPWFFTIVVNQCRMLRRSRWWSVITRPELEERLEHAEERWVGRLDVLRALSGLSPGDRAALWLRFGEDLSIEQVAAVLGISQSAAKARVYRAAGRLRPAMRLGEARP
ncbi:MAG TPA: sigma-70 family RNA polymerase sigma factor [Candidatus Dormibacteraeota bacterium]|nr:sigma-70 family RNA polymerase sigma factor [Candidatus Dormibacteraeota bacterium]